jgi:hypothetical protein
MPHQLTAKPNERKVIKTCLCFWIDFAIRFCSGMDGPSATNLSSIVRTLGLDYDSRVTVRR